MQPIRNQTVSDSKSITCAFPFFERFFFLSVLISSWWHSVFFLLIGFFDHIVLGLMTLNETRLEVFNCTDNFQLIFDCKTQLFVVLFKVILCSREVAVKARTSALTLLIECCNANFRSSGKTRQGEEISEIITTFLKTPCDVFFRIQLIHSSEVWVFLFYRLVVLLNSLVTILYLLFCFRMFDLFSGVGGCGHRGLTAHDKCHYHIPV